ncbi:MAG: hypothetical protein ACJ8FP_11085, partial [Xanthobacteraceae bacterium]
MFFRTASFQLAHDHERAGGSRSGRATAGLAGLLAALAFCVAALAADFPPLTGRIVDQANLLPAAERSQLETKLADLEAKS